MRHFAQEMYKKTFILEKVINLAFPRIPPPENKLTMNSNELEATYLHSKKAMCMN